MTPRVPNSCVFLALLAALLIAGDSAAREQKQHTAPPAPKVTAAAPAPRPSFTGEEQSRAVIPGMPDARFFADSIGDYRDALPTQEGPWLILSSGGSGGAYGAGLLNGWSEAGTRPEFAMVTGVSVGALMAPFAFLGAAHDDTLRRNFTEISAADIFEDRKGQAALLDTWPMKERIAAQITPELVAAVAAEHARGRRLFVVTASLDAERPVLWNMGAIAAHGGDAAVALFRNVLLAAASIPGEFPPVAIDVESDGKRLTELHADGGLFGPFYIAPEAWLLEPPSRPLPASHLYVVVNSKLTPEFFMTERSVVSVLARSISAAVKVGARAELALAAAAARRDGIALDAAAVDSGFDRPNRSLFDQSYMQALYDLGADAARKGTAFHRLAPAGGEMAGNPAVGGGETTGFSGKP
jgi:predicted acylesterase/phospholipase RssA